jgi:HEAT repeat protein
MLIAEFVLQSILDQVLTILVKGGYDFIEDLSTRKQIKNAIQSAVDRFEAEYPDKGLSSALVTNVAFFTLPSVQAGIQEYLTHPLSKSPELKIKESLSSLLSKPADNEKVIEATQHFLRLLRQELENVPKLQGLLQLAVGEKILDTLTAIQENTKVTHPDFERERRKYLQYIIDTHRYIDPRGVIQSRDSFSQKLDDVYVQVTAKKEKAGNKRPRLDEKALQSDAERFNRTDQGTDPAFSMINAENVDLAMTLRENTKLIILGEPGAGKTTFVRHLTLQFAMQYGEDQITDQENNNYGPSRIPISIRIANYADALSRDKSLSLRDFLVENCSESDIDKSILKEIFSDALRTGGAIVFLDGLDEVINDSDRANIERRIENFIFACNGENRFVITSRISNYYSIPFAGEFSIITLQRMERPLIENFLYKWYAAFERPYETALSDRAITEKISSEVDAILRVIDQNQRLKLLASNPLMLVILVLVFRDHQYFLPRKVLLYEKSIHILLNEWQALHHSRGERIVEDYEISGLLSPLAYWMYQNKSNGLITKTEACEMLAEFWTRANDSQSITFDIQKKAKNFFERLEESGLFTRFTENHYGFIHHSFQEYLVARCLTDKKNEIEEIVYKQRHNPRWNEIILLSLGILSDENPEHAEKLLRTSILAEGELAESRGYLSSDFENILHRDLLFAIRSAGECAELTEAFYEKISSKLLEVYLDYYEKGKYEPLLVQINEVIHSLYGSNYGKSLADVCLKFLYENNNQARRLRAALLLSNLEVWNSEIESTLLEILKSKDARMRLEAVYAIYQSGQETPHVVSNLLSTLNDTDPAVVSLAMAALVHLASANADLVSIFVDLIKQNGKHISIGSAGLMMIGTGKLHVVDTLAPLLMSEDKALRQNACITLTSLGDDGVEVIPTLLHAMENGNEKVSLSATIALSNLKSGGDSSTVKALLEMAEKENEDSRPYLPAYATIVLERWGIPTVSVVTKLLINLQSNDFKKRKQAAISLGRLKINAELMSFDLVMALAGLVAAISDQNLEVRLLSAVSLLKLGSKNTGLVRILFEAFKTSIDAEVFEQVVDILVTLGREVPEFKMEYLEALKSNNSRVRLLTAYMLREVGFNRPDPELNLRLQKTLQDKSKFVRFAAAGSLLYLGGMDSKVLAEIFSGIKGNNKKLRQEAISLIDELPVPPQACLDTLLLMLKDNNKSVRAKVFSSLGKLVNQHHKSLSEFDKARVFTALHESINDPRNSVIYDSDAFSGFYLYELIWRSLWNATLSN